MHYIQSIVFNPVVFPLTEKLWGAADTAGAGHREWGPAAVLRPGHQHRLPRRQGSKHVHSP